MPLVYRIDLDAAFDLLKWRSQEANVKLRVLAEQLSADFRAMEFYEDVPPRSTSTGYCSPHISACAHQPPATGEQRATPTDGVLVRCFGRSSMGYTPSTGSDPSRVITLPAERIGAFGCLASIQSIQM